MFNKDTRTILKQLSAINSEMILSYPVTCVRDGTHIQAFVDMTKFEEAFDEFGLHNIAEFNSVVNIIEDPTIEREGVALRISNKSQSIKYNTSDLITLEGTCRGKPELVGKVKTNDIVMTFDLSHEDLSNIKKMSGLITDLSTMKVTSVGESINMSVKGDNSEGNTYDVELTGIVNSDDSINLSLKLVNKLPITDYKVTIYKSSKGTLVALFNSTTIDGLEIILASQV